MAGYILSQDPVGLPQGEAKPQKHHSSQKREKLHWLEL